MFVDAYQSFLDKLHPSAFFEDQRQRRHAQLAIGECPTVASHRFVVHQSSGAFYPIKAAPKIVQRSFVMLKFPSQCTNSVPGDSGICPS